MTASCQLTLAQEKMKLNSFLCPSLRKALTAGVIQEALDKQRPHQRSTPPTFHHEPSSDPEGGAARRPQAMDRLQTWGLSKDVSFCLCWRSTLKMLADHVRIFLLFWNLLEWNRALLEFSSEQGSLMVSTISCLWPGCSNPNKASHSLLSCLDSVPVQT